MKESFRQSIAWLHNWAGLLVGWVLFFVFFNGTFGYVNHEVDRWIMLERPPTSQAVPADWALFVAEAYIIRQVPVPDDFAPAAPMLPLVSLIERAEALSVGQSFNRLSVDNRPRLGRAVLPYCRGLRLASLLNALAIAPP
ncbi:PepSY domain-containing protein [Altericroceibacterium spongiae]|uniref:PepSY domain-containing protein n=1 Tax=Altericroceibacterium spongiae TaxID=2320269 RepID=A0A420ES45_9SPHN|nr:PepSY-associated TM helix domain-containing protein [Altericroceibacterium spongiae]RKF23450.1 PepSY domain-containing protein [Altericroceibacterium spongiae]